MMEALKVMTYFKVILSTCNWDSAFFLGSRKGISQMGMTGRVPRAGQVASQALAADPWHDILPASDPVKPDPCKKVMAVCLTPVVVAF
ncbi:hypothetical protein [Aeromonas sanarellii]|uniref:hypothetical protein n=1 Tax=Aeromonas TaxID=642 RepID=UPI002DBEBB0D|nr:hypothetical protein [Aeromonas sanarellii]MEB6606643.1 hypothetical protein [Aeromonas sanarellii]